MNRYRIEFHLHNCRNPNENLKNQQYFFLGFKELDHTDLLFRPFPLPLFVWLRDRNLQQKSGLATFWRFRTLRNKDYYHRQQDRVGRYLIRNLSNGIEKRVAIDVFDGGDVRDPLSYEWADVYFKNNMWPTLAYPQKVRPLLNGDGFLDSRKIAYLKTFRNFKSECDLIYWAKIWEPWPSGLPKGIDVLEHQLRIFETLSEIKCNKKLLAIFPEEGLRYGNPDDCMSRLNKRGIACQYGWGNITSDVFWKNLASARVVFLRPGDRLCITWRLIGLFCMGSCVVFDGAPYPQWYEPIVSGIHYLDGECRLAPDFSLPEETAYGELKRKVEGLLSDPEQIASLKRNALHYYERFGSPQSVARHIIRCVEMGRPGMDLKHPSA